MLTRYWFSVFVLIVLLATGCSKKETPGPASDPRNIFETVWSDFDRHYPYFHHKNIDWDSIYDIYAGKISESTSNTALFNTIGEMTLVLKDIHVNLSSSLGNYHYSKKENYPRNSPDLASGYLDNVFLDNSKAVCGNIADEPFLYLQIKTFVGSTAEFRTIASMLDSLRSHEGLIIDIRDNGGGNELNGRAFAGRLSDSEQLYKYTRTRNGNNWDDFSLWHSSFFQPDDPVEFNKKIILLTNRSVYSSAELFVLMMQTYPKLLIVGDTTGGASANPAQRTMSNGWKYRVSTWQAATLDYELIEDNGIPPDHYVLMTDSSMNQGRDLIMEKAIELLNED
jgi:hypothetical protein